MDIRLSVLILFATLCFAATAEENMTIKFGSGVNHIPNSSLYSVGFEKYFENSKYLYKVDFGFWSDSHFKNKGSVFTDIMIGHKFGTIKSLNANFMIGLLLMSDPDRVLGSPYQSTEEISLDYKRLSIGIKHISNAGVKTPNLGRDYLFMNYTTPLTY